MTRVPGLACLVLPLALAGLASLAPAGLAGREISAGVQRFTLPNGLAVIVAVRPELELAAVNLTVDLGSIDDPPGQSGMAHILEHVTLSGSTTVGSLNPGTEAVALADLDRAYAALDRERRKTPPNPTALVGLEQWFDHAHQAARRACETGEILGGRLELRGAVGLNATTTADATQFFTWIPTGDLPLWITLEAERLRHPVLRRFYSEREVILREVAGLTGGQATLQERLLRELFPGAPLGQPLAGDLDQIRAIDRPAAFAYFHRTYRPERIAIAVVGRVDPEQVHRLCLDAFGDWRPEEPGELPRARRESTAPLAAPRFWTFTSARGSVVFLAAPRPPAVSAAALDVVAEVINAPDLSPLRRRLVDEQSLAWTVGASASYPAQKHTAIFLVHVNGLAGVPAQRLTQETSTLLRALARGTDDELAAAVLAAEMRLAAQLDDASAFASALAFDQAVRGRWNASFERLEQLRTLRANDVRAAARALFDALPPASVSLGDR
jgi:predicted Zn-dependent peptidase